MTEQVDASKPTGGDVPIAVAAPAALTGTGTAIAADMGTPAKRAKLNVAAHPSSDAFGPGEADSPSVRAATASARGNSRGRTTRGNYGGGDRRERTGRGGKQEKTSRGKGKDWGYKEGEGPSETPGEEGEKADRLPKKKVAVLIGYNGIGYSGSQINPGVDTVEGEVFKAFVAAGAVSEDNAGNPGKVGFTRAARTDAGVHAAVNVLAVKLILQPALLPVGTTLESYLNTFLPPAIRVWSILRVQGAFNPRTLCDQRQYEYTLPTHVFLGPKPGTAMHDWIAKCRPQPAVQPEEGPMVPKVGLNKREQAAAAAAVRSDEFWAALSAGSTFEEDLKAKKAWRISSELLESAREFVTAYEGSHNYYNFTVGKDFRDRSNQRCLRKLEISNPFIVNGTEYVSIGFLGQSFMLHQIRKMIGLTIIAVRSSTPPSIIAEIFGPSRVHVPKAPGLGLLLLEPQYQEYNKKVKNGNDKVNALAGGGKLDKDVAAEQLRDCVEIGSYKGVVDRFKEDEIYKRMWEVEEAEAIFTKWLNYLDVYVGPDFEYLNSKGVIPASAVFKKGENNEKTRGAAGQTNAVGQAQPDQDMAPPSDDEGATGGDAKEMEG